MWKAAKVKPLHKKGPLLDPNNYRMLAVSGTMYRLYVNVLRVYVTEWCQKKNKIPDTQFGFYPGRNTLQPMFILRHLQHAAQTRKPHGSPRLHAAFIDFKQAYDSIPRNALWEHLQRICMPACLLKIIQNLYDADEYVLVDGTKQARVRPSRGVKQGCPLSPLLFSLYINDVDCIARGVSGAVTGVDDVHVTHMLYADDLSLTANQPDHLQMMLDRLSTYAQRKGLIVNTSKSEVVHFNSRGTSVPVFTLGGSQLANKDAFKYLGMIFTKTHNMAAAAEHVLTPFMAGCRRIRQFASEHRLTDRPHSLLWLAKAYALPASMYASQIWGTKYMKQGAEMDCPLQIVHMCLLKGILGVKRTTPNWSVLRECGQEPLQFYWFRAAARFYNALLRSNSDTLAKVLKADIAMSAVNKKCWSAEFLDALHGLERSSDFQQRVRTVQAIPQSQFVVDVRKRLRSIWSQANQLGNDDQVNKAAKYHNWVALPLRPVTVDGPPFSLPRYLHLDLGRQTQRNVARFRLHSHTLRVETRSWQQHDHTCDKCGLQAVQDEKHALFLCPCMQMCSLRLQFADLFHDLPLANKITVNQTGAFYFSQACSEDVFKFFQRQTNDSYRFISELMDVFCIAGVHQQAEQSNYLAEGQIL